MRMCCDCGGEVYKHAGRTKWPKRCQNCHRNRSRQLREGSDQAARAQAWDRARKKGLTPDEVEGLRASQGGRCAVCGVAPPRHSDGRDGLYIDHRHDNGAVRGMLCPRCNAAAGALDRDPEYLRRLAVYVHRGADPGTPWVEVVFARKRSRGRPSDESQLSIVSPSAPRRH